MDITQEAGWNFREQVTGAGGPLTPDGGLSLCTEPAGLGQAPPWGTCSCTWSKVHPGGSKGANPAEKAGPCPGTAGVWVPS